MKKEKSKTKKMPEILYSLTHSFSGMAGVAIILLVLILTILAGVLAPYDPTELHAKYRLLAPSLKSVEEGMKPFLLGTDSMGRDLFSRILYGGRISLLLGLVAAVIGGTAGILLGMLAGYFPGKVDSFISYIINVQMAFPFTLLAIFMMAIFGNNMLNLIVVLAWSTWVNYARVMRGQVISIRNQEYINAAIVVGVRKKNILKKYVFPNTVSQVIVVMTMTIATVILFEAQLSFLGLGIDPTIPTWGSILSDGRNYMERAWWIAVFPGIAIFITVMGINLFGDWMRDYFDPRLRGK